VKRNCDNWLIFRPILLYGLPYVTGRDNWLTILIDKFNNNESINLVTDIMWQPTSARFCANTIWTLIDKENESFNVSQGNTLSMYDFGLMIQSVFAPDKKLVNPILSNELPSLTKRPQDTSYDISKIRQFVGIPKITDELQQYYDELQFLLKTAKPRLY
jgi:dTDP-4-dehydrorhamnose reductase